METVEMGCRHDGGYLFPDWPQPLLEAKKKGKKNCCEKYRKGKRCKKCPLGCPN